MTAPVVLNTRPREQASELSSLLRAAGCAVVEVPAIDIVPAYDTAELRTLATRDYAWLVLPSQNAARYLMQGLGGALPQAPIVCGTATARALGLLPTIALDRFSATAALAAVGPRLRRSQRVLVPRAAEGRDELIAGLTALGVFVDSPTCYRTEPVVFAELPPCDVVTLCSPSAVRAVAAVPLGSARIVCLGPTTASAARAAGVHVDGVAAETSMRSLVSAVRDTLEVPA
jgi:uroporphyrinogen-III synthase